MYPLHSPYMTVLTDVQRACGQVRSTVARYGRKSILLHQYVSIVNLPLCGHLLRSLLAYGQNFPISLLLHVIFEKNLSHTPVLVGQCLKRERWLRPPKILGGEGAGPSWSPTTREDHQIEHTHTCAKYPDWNCCTIEPSIQSILNNYGIAFG